METSVPGSVIVNRLLANMVESAGSRRSNNAMS